MISLIISILSIFSFSQIDEGKSLDKIVAIVGKDKILQSEVDAQMARLAEYQKVNFNDKEQRKSIINSMIDEKLMVTKAYEDSLEASEQEIEQRWEMLVENWKSQFGSEKRIEEIFKKSLSQIRYEYEKQISDQIVAMKLQQTKFGVISISPREVQDFYKIYEDSMQVVPDKYEIAIILKYVKANNTKKQEAFNKALRIRDSIIADSDFDKFAKNNSEDPNTAPDGGALGWFDRGRFIPEFEKAAFALQKDELSLPIETPFGFHIIKVIDKKENSINTKHILVKFGETSDNATETIEALNKIKEKFNSGSSFDTLALFNSEDEESRGFGGSIGPVSLEQMPPALREAIGDIKMGEVTNPIVYTIDQNKPAYIIALFKNFYPAHKMNLKDDYSVIEQIAKQNKQREMMQNWVKDLRKELYWEIID